MTQVVGIIQVTLRTLIGALLIATGIAKAMDPVGFAGVVGTYEVLPEFLWVPAAVFMVVTELALGATLLLGWRTSIAAMLSTLLHSGFLLWAGVALARGLELPNCGCFGVFFVRPLTIGTLYEDGVMIVVSLILWWSAKTSR